MSDSSVGHPTAPGARSPWGWVFLLLSGVVWIGCSTEPIPAPTPVAVSEGKSSPRAPAPEAAQPTATPARPFEGIRVRVPGWLAGAARKELLSRVSAVFPGKEIQLVDAEDPVRNRNWDLALLPRGASHPSAAPERAWVIESLAFYVNTALLRAKTPSQPTTWEMVARIAEKEIPSATTPRLLALPGDPPGLAQTLEALAYLAGATSGTRLADPRVARALDFLAELHRRGLYRIGDKEGLSANTAAGMVGTGQAILALGWETDMAWVADRTKSPVANRIEVRDPPSFQDYPRAKGKPTRVWCWTARETGGATQALESLVNSLTLWDPGPLPGGRWIGGITEAASFRAPSDLFVFDLRPGQDYRDTTAQLREGWKAGAKSLDLLRAFEIRFAQIQKELESGASP